MNKPQKTDLATSEDIVRYKDILKIFRSFLYMKDEDFIWLTLAVIIGNQMRLRRPIWLMLVAPPSSGKTTTLNALKGLKVFNADGMEIEPIQAISDLTENSFASGMISSGQETSLLKKIPWGGCMVFKDFTSVLSKERQAKITIMAQLREIYDGSYVKRTGNGKDVRWESKAGAIAGVTQAVYQHIESLSVMGDRFMLYQIPQPDRREMLKFKLNQEREGTTEETQMPKAQELVHKYMQRAFDNLREVSLDLPPEVEDEIIEVADFCTMVRSGVITDDFTGEIKFVPEPEMPARMFDQMIALASAFSYMRKLDLDDFDATDTLTEKDFKLIYKIAYDSIPITRRIALHYLAQYKNGVDTAALAAKTNYPTKVAGQWLAQLNALGIVDRIVGSNRGNVWRMKEQHIRLMSKLQNVKVLDESLLTTQDITENDIERSWEMDKRGLYGDDGTLEEMDDNGTW